MSKSKSHAGGRPVRHETGTARAAFGVDLGHEPPLAASGGDAADVDRREVNLRWLGASVLTGITGAALIGASIYIALQGALTFATPPERAETAPAKSRAPNPGSATPRKADKLVRQEMIASARHSFKAPTTIRTNGRGVIRVRLFVGVATNLYLTAGVHAS